MKCDRKKQEKTFSDVLPEQVPVKPKAVFCNGQGGTVWILLADLQSFSK